MKDLQLIRKNRKSTPHKTKLNQLLFIPVHVTSSMQLETKLHTCKSLDEYAMVHRVGLMLCRSTDSEKYPTKTLDRISGYKYIVMSLLIRGPKLLWFILPACLAETSSFFRFNLKCAR